MDDQEFLNRIRAKIERLAGREIGLHMDPEDKSRIKVSSHPPYPK